MINKEEIILNADTQEIWSLFETILLRLKENPNYKDITILDKDAYECVVKLQEDYEKDKSIEKVRVDSVGFVTEGDFKQSFKPEFIKERFYDLAHSWFNGVNSQVDFGIVMEVLREEFPEGVKKKCK